MPTFNNHSGAWGIEWIFLKLLKWWNADWLLLDILRYNGLFQVHISFFLKRCHSNFATYGPSNCVHMFSFNKENMLYAMPLWKWGGGLSWPPGWQLLCERRLSLLENVDHKFKAFFKCSNETFPYSSLFRWSKLFVKIQYISLEAISLHFWLVNKWFASVTT